MSKDSLERIEATVKAAQIDEAKRKELLGLVNTLRREVDSLAQTNEGDARSIASLADVSTREAMKDSPRQEVLNHSLLALGKSVEDFETSHPSLVRIVNAISMMLSNIGI